MESNSCSEDSWEYNVEQLRKVAMWINPIALEERDLLEMFLEICLHLHRIEEREKRLSSLEADVSFEVG